MQDHLLIYVIVWLNALSQAMLIWRLKLERMTKWKLCCTAIVVPLLLACSVRLLIAQGAIHVRIIDQPLIERLITKGLSMLLIAGPWIVTIFAIVMSRRSKTLTETNSI
jgi:hypothetical protein